MTRRKKDRVKQNYRWNMYGTVSFIQVFIHVHRKYRQLCMHVKLHIIHVILTLSIVTLGIDLLSRENSCSSF